MHRRETFTSEELRYLELLSRNFPNMAAASTEIINLEAILNLPKGTEHFLSDIHGEIEAFDHVLRNASGAVAQKVDAVFGNSLRERERRDLCTLIYYPKERLELVKRTEENIDEWYIITMNRLVKVCVAAASKYTRSKVRKALPEAFSYIIQELMHESEDDEDKMAYFHQILQSINSIGRSEACIIAMCELIQRLVIDKLHIVGDIYDRGLGAHLIMEKLMAYHDVDIQWGNHDVLWMGAAAGNDACIANVLRISLRYANLTTLEEGYGINLLPLATFAMEVYANDPCDIFLPKLTFADMEYSEKNIRLISQMHKAISIIQWKLEHALISRHPDWQMDDRNLLHKIDFEKGVVVINGNEYALKDIAFPTVDPKDPYRLTEDEQELVAKLHHSFIDSSKLFKHLNFMLDKGSLYLVFNGNLMFHASVPMNEDGTCKEVCLDGVNYKGKAYLDEVDRLVRMACVRKGKIDGYEFALDYMWYWWCGPDSPTFDKNRMATFERYLLADKETHKEIQGAYYRLRTDPAVCDRLLDEFGVEGTHRHIINGHVPVKTLKGESPLKADGKMLVIDGGFSRAYHSETGIAGYTLVFHSHGLQLVQHEPFESRRQAIENGVDIKSTRFLVEFDSQPMRVRDTDIGKQLRTQVEDLKRLLLAYRIGVIK